MAKVIMIEAKDVWYYYQAHIDELEGEMHEIAEDADGGVFIFITDNCGKASVVVVVDGREAYSENMLSGGDCKMNVEKIYRWYLDGAPPFSECEGDFQEQYGFNLTEKQKNEKIRDRENELDVAIEDLLLALMNGSSQPVPDCIDDIASDLKEGIINYVVDEYGFDIYRPTYHNDEYGELYFDMFPYRYKDRVFE